MIINGEFDILFLFSNLIRCYIFYSFFHIFFLENHVHKKVFQILSFILFFIVTSINYLSLNIPIINILVMILLLLIISLNYKISSYKRILLVAIICGLNYISEGIVVFIFVLIGIDSPEEQRSLILIPAVLIMFFLISLIKYFYLRMEGNTKSFINIIAVFLVSILSIYIAFILAVDILNNNIWYIGIGFLFLVLINIFTIYFYDIIDRQYKYKMEKEVIRRQHEYYSKQYDLISSSLEKNQILRHDMKNHLYTLKTLIEENDKTHALKYIDNLIKSTILKNEFAKSGNIIIDSILNYKLNEVQKLNVNVKLKLDIPCDWNVDATDICIILGNTLDNALEALSKVSGEKRIEIYIQFQKGVVYIKIKNTFDGVIKSKRGHLLTRRENSTSGDEHGIGLLSVQKSIEKYHGNMDISYDEKEFTIEIILYSK